ncbi:uncharacterized protein PHALS_11569 [Plasmopara halstedii]|uniref:Uncharacterized protein n=1 Tax=Plasmopara halstedii TaxID=4781 RepID=A0A0P1AKP6_PLAHL|nr:uncharacterized protein PHALS_11569 [Plasmopara halstedii]CEG41206.1 hypothetical protein PHALS_11569 [Plasmopara halstedii]|eukprot:XP_024577575.1 hypothetical protein PHALS_11569 [Plasmopara halstedii]
MSDPELEMDDHYVTLLLPHLCQKKERNRRTQNATAASVVVISKKSSSRDSAPCLEYRLESKSSKHPRAWMKKGKEIVYRNLQFA